MAAALETAMLALAAAAALALAAPADPLPFGGRLPYPAPKLVQVTERTKCDFATVVAIDAAHGKMQGSTRAGVVTYVVGADVQVISKDGTPAGAGLSAVTVGAKMRVYYVIDDGARVLEIDLD